MKGCNPNKNMSKLNLTREWDKTFPKSERVNHCKVTFRNRYGIDLAADMYVPKNANGKLPAIAVSGPFGAVKEQSSGLYAQHMAERGFHPRSGNSTDGWNVTGTVSFLNQPLLDMAGEIKTPVLLIHCEKAHSRYFSEGAFARLKGDNKELCIIPGAVHTDLYDDVAGVIPYDKMESFFKESLK